MSRSKWSWLNYYQQEPLTWGNLAKIIERMTPAQREREVMAHGWFPSSEVYIKQLNEDNDKAGYKFVRLCKLLITNESDKEFGDPDQPVLLF